MAEEKKLSPQYIIVATKTDLGGIQALVNKQIEKGYVPYGQLMIIDGQYTQTMIDPQLLDITVKKATVVATSTVTIPGTVNVSGCGGE